ncbi:hypothetical protein JCM10212_004749 [Sporobolomyces blumeae]
MDFDPLNSPSRPEPCLDGIPDLKSWTGPVSFSSPPRSSPPAPPAIVVTDDSPLIDLTSPLPFRRVGGPSNAFEPRPLTLSAMHPTRATSTSSRTGSNSPTSIWEDRNGVHDVDSAGFDEGPSFFHLPPSRAPAPSSEGQDPVEFEGGKLVSFIQDSPPRVVRTIRHHLVSSSSGPKSTNDENVPPIAETSSEGKSEGSENAVGKKGRSKRPSYGGGGGKKWGVMARIAQDKADGRDSGDNVTPDPQTRSSTLSVVRRTLGPDSSVVRPGDVSTIHFDTPADVSLIADEGGSFFLKPDFDESVLISPSGPPIANRARIGGPSERNGKGKVGKAGKLRLSRIGEEDDEGERSDDRHRRSATSTSAPRRLHDDGLGEKKRSDPDRRGLGIPPPPIEDESAGMTTLFQAQLANPLGTIHKADATRDGDLDDVSTSRFVVPSSFDDTSLIVSTKALDPLYRSFSTSTLPRQFDSSRVAVDASRSLFVDRSVALAPGRSLARVDESEPVKSNKANSLLPPSSSSSSILPPELVSPVKRTRFPPPSPSLMSFQTPRAAAPSRSSSSSSALSSRPRALFDQADSASSGIKRDRHVAIRTEAKGNSSRSDESDDEIAGMDQPTAMGEMTTFWGWDKGGLGAESILANGERTGETTTAIIDQLPPTGVLKAETTRTIELSLPAPLLPRSKSTSALNDTNGRSTTTKRDESAIDLMRMEEPSMLREADDTRFDSLSRSIAVEHARSGSGGLGSASIGRPGAKDAQPVQSGADRLRARLDELRKAKSSAVSSPRPASSALAPSTPVPATVKATNRRFVSLLDQTPAPGPSFSTLSKTPPGPSFSTLSKTRDGPGQEPARRPGKELGRSKTEPIVGTLIALETPRPASASASTASRTSSTTDGPTSTRRIRAPRPSTLVVRPPATPSASSQDVSLESGSKTPGERKESTRARLERLREERRTRELAGGSGEMAGFRRSSSATGLDATATAAVKRDSQSRVGTAVGGGGAGSGATGLRRGNSLVDVKSKHPGYDQGVMSGLITLNRFIEVIPQITDPDISGITVAIYEIGCMFGAIAAIFFGDKLGRKTTIMYGMCILIVGAIIMTASNGLAPFIVGRIVGGFGNGLNTASIPALQSELAPPAIRGSLVLISGALIALGIAVAYWVELGCYFVDSTFAWRFPIAFQMVFALITMVLLLGIPESPAWLLKHGDVEGNVEEARTTLANIYKVDRDDEMISGQIDAVQRTGAEVAAFRFRDLFTNGPSQNFRRASLAFVSQMFQQITGINLVSYYASSIFESSLGLSPFISRLMGAVLSTEYFVAAALTTTFVDRLGRRPTMIAGAIGCGLAFVVATALVYQSDRGSKACAWGAVAMYFVYNTSFAFGWLGQTWLYPAEITSVAIRAQANGLSTVANWLFNFVIVMVTPPGFANIGNWLYLVFAIINLGVILPSVYLFFPETAGRSLEEIDVIFAEVYADPSLGYVKHSKTRPSTSGRELDAALETALRAGKVRQSGQVQHLEVAGDEKDRGLLQTRSSSSGRSGAASGRAEKGQTTMREFV